MEIEFHYNREITGLLISRSKEVSTKQVREFSKFSVPEFNNSEAPVAYKRYRPDNSVLDETRWANGGHWHVTDSVPSSDGMTLILPMMDFELIYEGLIEPGKNPRVADAKHGFVDKDKKWHRIDSDNADLALERAQNHFSNNTAIIDGKFAYRIVEPSLELSIRDLYGAGHYTMVVNHSRRQTTNDRRWYFKYGLSLNEASEVLDDLNQFFAAEFDISMLPTPADYEVLIPEAFSTSLAEEASLKILKDGLRAADSCFKEFDMTTRIAYASLVEAIGEADVISVDTADAIAKFEVLGESLGRAKIKKGQRQEALLSYIRYDMKATKYQLLKARSQNTTFTSDRSNSYI